MSLSRCLNGHMFSSRRHGNTCPYCNVVVEQSSRNASPIAQSEDEIEKTMPYLGETEGIEPVTGWLVCIEGPCDRQVKLNNFRSFILNSWTFKNGRTMSHTITVPI